METWEQIAATARPGKAFSNGTEGYAWFETWCATCLHDKGARLDEQGVSADKIKALGLEPSGCPLWTFALVEDATPGVWEEQPWRQITGRPEGQTAPTLGDKYHCAEYTHDPDTDDGGGGPPNDEPDPDPGPPPTLNGQTDIFEVFAENLAAEITDQQRELVRG
jgi:hypothetical protein